MTAMPPPPPPPPSPQSGKQGKPFYKRWWVWVVVIVVVIIAATAGSSGNKKKSSADSSQSPTQSASATASSSSPAPSSTSPSVPKASQGFGSQDASKDVTLGTLQRKDDGLGNIEYSVPVTVTNHSSKRSDYVITIALESADGKSQIDTATVFAQNVEPGQTTEDDGDFLKADTSDTKVPSNARLVLQEVQRTEAF